MHTKTFFSIAALATVIMLTGAACQYTKKTSTVNSADTNPTGVLNVRTENINTDFNTTLNENTNATTTNTTNENANESASVSPITIENFSFVPTSLTVKKDTTVTWTNNDSTSHTVTSTAGSELSSGTLGVGQTYSHTFTIAGTYQYHCSFHPSMTGTIVVTE